MKVKKPFDTNSASRISTQVHAEACEECSSPGVGVGLSMLQCGH